MAAPSDVESGVEAIAFIRALRCVVGAGAENQTGPKGGVELLAFSQNRSCVKRRNIAFE